MMMITLIVQVLLRTVFSSSLIHMVSLINALQFIFHLPIMSVIFPANLLSYFTFMIPLVMFDVLDDIPLFESFFVAKDNGSDIRDQMEDLGYATRNPLLVLKTLIALQFLYAARLFCLFAVLYPLKKCLKGAYKEFFKKHYKAMFRQLIFTEILAIFFGSIIEFLIAASLQMRASDDNPYDSPMFLAFSIYFLAIPILIIPVIFSWVFTKNLWEIKRLEF